jgi:nucleotide-binding universal stress UspA family protein
MATDLPEATKPLSPRPLDPYAVGGPVVVGVDGTPHSVPALRWAAEEALRRFTEVVAVHACVPPPPVASYAPVPPPAPDLDEQVEIETEHLAELVRAALGVEPAVPVRQLCEPASPVRALLSHAEGASLLVLATGIDLATGSGVGPTALACVRHAPCPVVILHTGGRT